MVDKKKKSKKEAPVKNIVNDKPKSKPTELDLLAQKRQYLIDEIKSNIMSNGQLKKGGAGVASKHRQEVVNLTPVIQEINEIGAKLGVRSIGLGNLRG